MRKTQLHPSILRLCKQMQKQLFVESSSKFQIISHPACLSKTIAMLVLKQQYLRLPLDVGRARTLQKSSFLRTALYIALFKSSSASTSTSTASSQSALFDDRELLAAKAFVNLAPSALYKSSLLFLFFFCAHGWRKKWFRRTETSISATTYFQSRNGHIYWVRDSSSRACDFSICQLSWCPA